MNAITAVLGEHARHVPCWLYVQDQGKGVVSIVGASRTGASRHPLRYDSARTHQLIVGEIVVRPHSIVATDALRGMGLSGLVSHPYDIDSMLANGERLLEGT